MNLKRLLWFIPVLIMSVQLQAAVSRIESFPLDTVRTLELMSDSISNTRCFAPIEERIANIVRSNTPETALDSAILAFRNGESPLALEYLDAYLSCETENAGRGLAFYLKTMLFFAQAVATPTSTESREQILLTSVALAFTDSTLAYCGDEAGIWAIKGYLCDFLEDSVCVNLSIHQLRQLAPNHHRAMNWAAILSYQANKLESADSLFASAQELRSIDSDGLTRWARLKFRLGQYRECADLCDSVLVKDLSRLDIKRLKGRALYDSERYGEVVSVLAEVVARDSVDEWSWFRLGYSQRVTGDCERAVYSMRKVLTIDSTWPDCYYNLARCAESNEAFDLAVIYADSAVLLDPEASENYWLKGWLENRAEMTERSVATYKRAIDLDHANADIWWELTSPLWKLHREAEMWNAIDSTLKYEPNLERALKYSGEQFLLKKKYKRSVQCYERLTKIQPNATEYWSQLSVLHFLLGSYQDALKCCKKALGISPNRPDLVQQKEEILLKLRRKE